MNHFGRDLTEGSIPKNLLLFALPVFLGNILSAGYGIVNAIWVGQLLGGASVAAAGVTFPIFLMMIALCNSGTMATSVLIAQHFGAKRHDEIHKVVNTSWTFGLILIVVSTAAGIFGARGILQFMGTPPEILDLATLYLQLSVAGLVMMYLSFLVMATLRAVGDSKTPLIFAVIGTVLNAILDPLLIVGIGPFPRLELPGAAYAALIASAITTLFGLVYLLKKYGNSPLRPRKFELDRVVVGQIAGIGFPSFVQQTILSIAIGFMMFFVNRYGADATAAFGIASRIDGIVVVPAIAVMIAVSTFVAQSIGAGKLHQIPKIYQSGLLINTPLIALIALLSVIFPHAIMHLFVQDDKIVAIGEGYLRIVGVAYLCLIPLYVANGIIIGTRKTMVTMYNSIIALCGVRIPLAALLTTTLLGLTGIWWATAASLAVNAILGFVWYRSGEWKKVKSVSKEK